MATGRVVMCVDELMELLGEHSSERSVFVGADRRLYLMDCDGYEATVIEIPWLEEAKGKGERLDD